MVAHEEFCHRPESRIGVEDRGCNRSAQHVGDAVREILESDRVETEGTKILIGIDVPRLDRQHLGRH